jgi:hypothetical protein
VVKNVVYIICENKNLYELHIKENELELIKIREFTDDFKNIIISKEDNNILIYKLTKYGKLEFLLDLNKDVKNETTYINTHITAVPNLEEINLMQDLYKKYEDIFERKAKTNSKTDEKNEDIIENKNVYSPEYWEF